ncbi:zinc-dependent alcohol dehydrogenase family protein [Nonomuraea glycinis]|uniref:Probable alcohol dehydrogenase AdhA n=1 Tax=Nonomuraea glycinis TaxID=2047744 RepID=A0A918A9E5_9ACTN|nr:zinc-dependent alcohol dehydrogenase family protein [Nonomuraea glycinis]MCA2179036.1 zinc-dependent alcohol dehydrogenase family protein [Nonomuraea glycinis]GGP08547.1 alcohol dehydrogenase [Nonomuraea glycinis]
MRAWAVDRPGPMGSRPLRMVERPVPVPRPGEVLVRVAACGVCRTDLHLAEGDLAPHRPLTTPGHQVVGRVVRPDGSDGGRAGVAWLRSTCGSCRYCLRDQENLCPSSTYTGWDADGGFAEYLTAPAAYVYPLPEDVPAERLAPLLCAGIVGYRALLRCDLPPGGRLGVYGFGASAHLTAQAAIALGAVVHVVTRAAAHRELALELGAASALDRPPEPLDAAILFAPAGELVPVALEALDRGGTLAVAGIHLTDIPSLNYDRHLFQERTLRSVTANTRADGRAYLDLVRAHPPVVRSVPYAFEDADQALTDLSNDQVKGAAVLHVC